MSTHLGPQPCVPFPYFGGKARAASVVWRHLGDPLRYVEPFGGSLAVLLARPTVSKPRFEMVNDSDGHLVNFWRATKYAPLDVARIAAGPVLEPDVHACNIALRTEGPEFVSWLAGDLEHYDARRAGIWLYATLWSIGGSRNPGPWVRGEDGALVQGAPGAGIIRGLPRVGVDSSGVSGAAAPGLSLEEHVQAMTERLTWFQNRLSGVRITCGDWSRVTTQTTVQGAGLASAAAVFLDPPYAVSGDLYSHDDNVADVAAQVRQWCISDADPAWRIILAGFEQEHDELLNHGWTKVQGKSGRGCGMNKDPLAGRRERLWLSPACEQLQASLFDDLAD